MTRRRRPYRRTGACKAVNAIGAAVLLVGTAVTRGGIVSDLDCVVALGVANAFFACAHHLSPRVDYRRIDQLERADREWRRRKGQW
jgi:hypothetical protein